MRCDYNRWGFGASISQPDIRVNVVMWSGGYDSTAYLVDALKNGQEVHAHHIILKSPEGRHKAEIRAINNMLPGLKEIKDFTLTESEWDYSAPGFFGWDLLIAAFVGAVVATGYNTKGRFCDVMLGFQAADVRHERTKLFFNEAVADIPENRRPKLCWPLREKTKAELIEMIPPEIRKYVWTCRTPINDFERCGKCHACKAIEGLTDAA